MPMCSLGENVYWVFLMHLNVKLHSAWLVHGDIIKVFIKLFEKGAIFLVPITEVSPKGGIN